MSTPVATPRRRTARPVPAAVITQMKNLSALLDEAVTRPNCATCDLPPTSNCAFGNCKRNLAATAKAKANGGTL